MISFELSKANERSVEKQPSTVEGLSSGILHRNAEWFIRVRWIVSAVFVLSGLIGFFWATPLRRFGLELPWLWLWILAAVLIGLNLLLYGIFIKNDSATPRNSILSNLYIQIGVDLVVLTLLVHHIGSTDTFISFTYLFHIALACIFLPKKGSMVVTMGAAFLYLFIVALEAADAWVTPPIFIRPEVTADWNAARQIIFAASAVFIWIVVWYLVSTLSEAVRKRDQRIHRANDELIRANREKNQQMLLTTHDLKAPFAGIETNVQVLKYQYWDAIPDTVRLVIEKIDKRAQTLRERITEILLLGKLRSSGEADEKSETVDLKELLGEISANLYDKAKERKVTLNMEVLSLSASGSRAHLVILLTNLIANAIMYSHEGGIVTLKAYQNQGTTVVSIEDKGIGIREDALPHIFDEYFVTREAKKFNRSSTGLGLAIVKEIVQRSGMTLKVISELGKGSTFEVHLK